MLVKDKDIMKVNKELIKLRKENAEMKERLQNYIPRRRVRRVFKSLKSVLEQDIQNDNKQYVEKLKTFIQKIEKEGPQMADNDIKQAIECLLGDYELKDPEINPALLPLGEAIAHAVEQAQLGRMM